MRHWTCVWSPAASENPSVSLLQRQGGPVCPWWRRGGLPEIVADGETGFLVEAEQPKQLADQLQKLIQDPALRREMGEQGHERALEHFTRERMVNEIDELLVSLTR